MEHLKYWFNDLSRSWKRVSPIAWLLLSIGVAVSGYEAITLIRLYQLDAPPPPFQADQDLSGYNNIQLFKVALELDEKGDYQEALQIYNQLENDSDENFKEQVKYNMGYIYLREAAALWNTQGVWAYAELSTLVNLAKEYYRQVLRMNPENWDARYNYEYALRITPPPKEVEKSDWTGRKSSVHAVLPGIPGGGP